MTSLYLARKSALCCPRCGDPSSATSVLCEPHRQDAADRVRRFQTAQRGDRRSRGLCAGCGQASATYRCAGCRGTEVRA